MLVHEKGGNSLLWWQQVDRFASRDRCILVDLSGHGRSRGGPDPSASDGADVLSVPDHLGVGKLEALLLNA